MAKLNKDCAKLVKQARKEGWRLVEGKQHPRLYPPDNGEFIVLPGSPSDHRAYKNVRAEMRRRGVSV